ncbi:MAG: ELM1/GtrOC1 family putative glycosyltransferase, partial [Alphaproteobacteria bacterium]
IIAPQHDRLVGNNIIPILGGLNDLNRAKLDAYLPENYGSHAARPKILLLIGGDNSQFRFDQDCMNALIGWIKQQAGNYDFMVSASRRTDSKARDALHKICDAQQHLFFDPVTMADQPNPYFKWLAMADHIIVSQDSVNMISEALMSERPVYCYLLTRKAKKINKFDQFIANLQRHNLLTLLTPQDLMTGDFNKVSAQKTIDISPLADQKHYILDRILDKMTAL